MNGLLFDIVSADAGVHSDRMSQRVRESQSQSL